MTITINGERREVAPGQPLDELIGELGVRRDGMAVAINDTVVPASAIAGRKLADGDVVEIIVAVAGG